MLEMTEEIAQQGFLAPTYFPPSGGESGDDDEELTVLPRHTKVVVRGNNRTKSVLVGLQGVVKKAVGLGGWHWLVLTNGVEVKLQRNALTVLEPPTGQEEDDEIEIPFSNDSVIDDFPRTFKPRVRPQKPPKPSENVHTSPKRDTKKADITTPSSTTITTTTTTAATTTTMTTAMVTTTMTTGFPMVDLSKLETSALRKYRKHFKLNDAGPNPSKEQLLRVIGKHFVSHQLDETEVITGFLQGPKRAKT